MHEAQRPRVSGQWPVLEHLSLVLHAPISCLKSSAILMLIPKGNFVPPKGVILIFALETNLYLGQAMGMAALRVIRCIELKLARSKNQGEHLP